MLRSSESFIKDQILGKKLVQSVLHKLECKACLYTKNYTILHPYYKVIFCPQKPSLDDSHDKNLAWIIIRKFSLKNISMSIASI